MQYDQILQYVLIQNQEGREPGKGIGDFKTARRGYVMARSGNILIFKQVGY